MSDFSIGPNCKLTFYNDPESKVVHTGDNLVCRVLMDYYDKDTKKIKLEQYANIEHTVYLKIFGHERIYGKPLETNTKDEETESTAVYYLNFQLKQGQIVDFKETKNKLSLGLAHDLYPYEIIVKDEHRVELEKNFV